MVNKTKPYFFTQNFIQEVLRCAKNEVEYSKENSVSYNRSKFIKSCVNEEKYNFCVLTFIQDLIINYKEEFTAPLYFINKIEVELLKISKKPVFSTHLSQDNSYYLKEII